MTFYENLRDNTALPLISRFGQVGEYQVGGEVYDNERGSIVSGSPTRVTINLLDLPKKERFNEVASATTEDAELLVEASAFAQAGIEPEVGARIVFGGKKFIIQRVDPVSPQGTAVIYKMGVSYA